MSLNASAPGEGDSPGSTEGGLDRRPSAEALRAAETAYREMYPMLLSMGRRAGFDEAAQKELVQRVGMSLVERMHEHDPSKGTLRMWAAGIARYAVLDMLRAERVEQIRFDPRVSVQELPSPDLTPEETFRARESLARLLAAVPPASREIVRLAALGCTAAEIAARLSLSRSRVEWRLREARHALVAAARVLGEDAHTLGEDAHALGEEARALGEDAHSLSPGAKEEAESRADRSRAVALLAAAPGARGRLSFLSKLSSAGALAVTAARPLALAAARPLAVAATVVLAIVGVLGPLKGGEVAAAPAAAAPPHANVAVATAMDPPPARVPVPASMAVPPEVLRSRSQPRTAPATPRERDPHPGRAAAPSGREPHPGKAATRRREMLVKRAVLAFRREGVTLPKWALGVAEEL
ncbi:MAG: sigma-70 family RNA polymerase sigma factor [Polyangiaceae bacterium]